MFKKTLLISALLATGIANAANGFYFAPYLGWGKVDASYAGSSKQDNTGFAASFSLGDQFNNNFAAEALFTTFAKQTYDSGITGSESYFYGVAAKGILPIQNGMNLFAKLGVGGAHRSLSPSTVTNGGNKTELTGIYALGMGYDLNQSIAFEAQWLSSIKNGSVPAMGAALAGIKFSFV